MARMHIINVLWCTQEYEGTPTITSTESLLLFETTQRPKGSYRPSTYLPLTFFVNTLSLYPMTSQMAQFT